MFLLGKVGITLRRGHHRRNRQLRCVGISSIHLLSGIPLANPLPSRPVILPSLSWDPLRVDVDPSCSRLPGSESQTQKCPCEVSVSGTGPGNHRTRSSSWGPQRLDWRSGAISQNQSAPVTHHSQTGTVQYPVLILDRLLPR